MFFETVIENMKNEIKSFMLFVFHPIYHIHLDINRLRVHPTISKFMLYTENELLETISRKIQFV